MFFGVMTSAQSPISTICPFCMIMARSQYLAASTRSWVTTTARMPFSSTRSLTRSIRSNWLFISRCRVGSSNSRTSGSCTRALAIITLLCSPPLSSFMLLSI